MRRTLLFLILTLGCCSKGPEADLQYISQARSLIAEWALINEQAEGAKLSATYVRAMRGDLREHLQTTAKALTQPNSRYADEIHAALAERCDASPQQLRAHADQLKRIESSLEST